MLKSVAKSLVAGGVAFSGALGTAASDGHVTVTEWCIVAGATLAALGLVWGVPNTPTD